MKYGNEEKKCQLLPLVKKNALDLLSFLMLQYDCTDACFNKLKIGITKARALKAVDKCRYLLFKKKKCYVFTYKELIFLFLFYSRLQTAPILGTTIPN